MKKTWLSILTIFLLLPLLMPTQAHAATTSVTTKTESYKGQPYVRIVGNTKAIQQINLILKQYAVGAATLDAEAKKKNKDFWFKTTSKVMYNNQNLISVVNEVSSFNGGAHDIQWTDTFNYHVPTGKRVYLKDILTTSNKIYLAKAYISYTLSEKIRKGSTAIFPESVNNFPFDLVKTKFYARENGFTVRFDPYEVAPFSEGFVEVTIPFSALELQVPTPTPLPVLPTPTNPAPTNGTIVSKIADTFEGFEDKNVYVLDNGQIWQQDDYHYHYAYKYRPDVVIYKDGINYYMIVEDQDDKVKVKRIK